MGWLLHEAIVDVLRSDPQELVELVRILAGARLSSAWVAVAEADLPQHVRPPLRCDLVLALGRGKRRNGIVVEVQLARDDDKRWTWPVYHAQVRARLRGEVCFIVVATSHEVARWARRCVDFEQAGMSFRPWVLGPDTMFRITDLETAYRTPRRAILSALIHGGGQDLDVATAAVAALSAVQLLWGDLT